MAYKSIFCARCQEATDHALTVDRNNEIVATCDCGAFLKAPAGMEAEDMNAYFAKHEVNEGQVSAAALEKQRIEAEKVLEAIGE